MWLEPLSQFVPAPCAAANVQLTIPGGEESAAVWELTTTEVRSLPRERVAGGLQVTLPRFDLTTVLWMTSSPGLVDHARERIAQTKAHSAQIAIELAQLKLDRVGQVDHRLQDYAPSPPDAAQLLGLAKLRLERAEKELQAGNAHAARLRAGETLQLLRTLQRAHWELAAKSLSTPVSSPYLVSFQSLPEHWRLLAQLGRSQSTTERNLLPSGAFEDVDAWIGEGWEHHQTEQEGLRASAELYPSGRGSQYALRLVCEPAAGTRPPRLVAEPPVTVTTPALTVHAGQVLHISGWIKVSGLITGSRDGVQIYESLLGKSAALRFRETTDWQQFELLRPVTNSRDWRLTISLTGLGEVLLDDLRVIPQQAKLASGTIEPASAQQPAGPSRKGWERWPRRGAPAP
jgi:hypothetical protein